MNGGGGGKGGCGARPGDWYCPNEECMNAKKAVFGSKDMCPQCGAPKESGTPVTASNANVAPGEARDWLCPNPQCMNSTKGVFGRHLSCPKCGQPRVEGVITGMVQQP